MFVFFFFQAEDGIRDLVRSRGLGDVYKRQLVYSVMQGDTVLMYDNTEINHLIDTSSEIEDSIAVSYTHLTLPTSDLV